MVTSLALGQSKHCPNANDMGKIGQKYTATKHNEAINVLHIHNSRDVPYLAINALDPRICGYISKYVLFQDLFKNWNIQLSH